MLLTPCWPTSSKQAAFPPERCPEVLHERSSFWWVLLKIVGGRLAKTRSLKTCTPFRSCARARNGERKLCSRLVVKVDSSVILSAVEGSGSATEASVNVLSLEAPVFYPQPKPGLEATKGQQAAVTNPSLQKTSRGASMRKGEAQGILIGMRGTRIQNNPHIGA